MRENLEDGWGQDHEFNRNFEVFEGFMFLRTKISVVADF